MGATCSACCKSEEGNVDVGGPSDDKVSEPPTAFAEEAQEPEKEPEEDISGNFTMVLHNAEIKRSFAKFGHMDPYAIIDVDGREVGRSKPDKSAHKTPRWDATFTWEGVPRDIHIAVWDKNDFHRDVFIGAVTIPCSTDVGRQTGLAFTITKRSEATGTIKLDLAFKSDEHKRLSVARKPTLGALEFDHAFSPTQTELAPLQLEETAAHHKAAEHDGDEEAPKLERQVTSLTKEESSHFSMPIMGFWKCVDTYGLDAFLKATGVGMFQRKIANAAKWPSWEYSLSGEEVVFVNHSAIGDLKETFPLEKEYAWKDGHGNPMTCKASWVRSDDGGTLFTERKGAIGSYKEERKVVGNRLEFKLIHGTGVEWGRVFEKSV